MLRLIHSFDVKSDVQVESFIEWLDHELWERSKPFGCLERKTWIYLDGIEGTYEHGKPAKRPRYLNEAFWPHLAQKAPVRGVPQLRQSDRPVATVDMGSS